MTTYGRRERIARIVEYTVPVDSGGGWRGLGVDGGTFHKVERLAAAEFERMAGRPVEYDDDLWYRSTDDGIVISFDVGKRETT